MAIPEKYTVWVVDKKAANFEMVQNSIPDRSWVNLRHIPSGEEFLEACSNCASDPDKLPHVVLIDFFLESMFGNDVLEKFNEIFEMAPPENKPYVIAFSSMDNANEALVAQGAPWSILKVKESEKLLELEELFASKEKLAGHLGHS